MANRQIKTVNRRKQEALTYRQIDGHTGIVETSWSDTARMKEQIN